MIDSSEHLGTLLVAEKGLGLVAEYLNFLLTYLQTFPKMMRQEQAALDLYWSEPLVVKLDIAKVLADILVAVRASARLPLAGSS
jgi:hypothetical protein